MESVPSSLPSWSAAQCVHDNDELRREISSYLPKSEQLVCARASRRWSETALEGIWREVKLGRFMNLADIKVRALQLESSRKSDAGIPSSSSSCLHFVRHIQVDHGDLETTLPLARCLRLRYPNLHTMHGVAKNRRWTIDFADRSITSWRYVNDWETVFAIGKNGTIPGFKIIDQMELGIQLNSYTFVGGERGVDIVAREAGMRIIPLDAIMKYNIRGPDDTSDTTLYETPVETLSLVTSQAGLSTLKWWNDIPSMRHVEKIRVTYWHGQAQLEDLEHLLKSKYIRTLVIECGEEEDPVLPPLPEILLLAWHRDAGDLHIKLKCKVDRSDAYRLRLAAKELKDVWGIKGLRTGDGECSGTPSRLSIECKYQCYDASTVDQGKIERHLEASERILESLSDNIHVDFAENTRGY